MHNNQLYPRIIFFFGYHVNYISYFRIYLIHFPVTLPLFKGRFCQLIFEMFLVKLYDHWAWEISEFNIRKIIDYFWYIFSTVLFCSQADYSDLGHLLMTFFINMFEIYWCKSLGENTFIPYKKYNFGFQKHLTNNRKNWRKNFFGWCMIFDRHILKIKWVSYKWYFFCHLQYSVLYKHLAH